MRNAYQNIFITLTVLLTAGCSSLSKQDYVDIPVSAVVNNIQKNEPFCFMKKETVKAEPGLLANLLAAGVGGFVGNQFGDGRGQDIATVVGAGTAVAIINTDTEKETGELTCVDGGYSATVSYNHPITKAFVTDNVPIDSQYKAKRITIPVRVPYHLVAPKT